MRRFIETTIASLIVLILTIYPASAAMDMGQFLDQTKAQLSNLGVKSYEGQERGYYMGGSARIRIPQETIQPISVTPPSVKAGCGGIDIVLGGFSYLNFEHLVQKLQSILQAAPAFAFELALGTLCPDCKNILDSLEAISNMINQLNVDSCQASKALVGYAGSKMGLISADKQSDGTNDSYFTSLKETINNYQDRYRSFIEKYAGAYDCSTSANKANCMKTMGKFSLRHSLLQIAFSDKSQYKFLEDAMRAKIGDVFEKDAMAPGGDGTVALQHVPPCEEASNSSLGDALVWGEFTTRSLSGSAGSYTAGNCTHNTSAGTQGYYTVVANALKSIRDKIKTGAALTAAEQNIVNSTSYPIYRILSAAVLVEKVGGDSGDILSNGFIEHVSLPISYEIAKNAYEHLYSFLHSVAVSMRTDISTSEIGVPNLAKVIDDMRARIQDDYDMVQNAYEAARAEFRTSFGDLYARYTDMQQFVMQKLAENKLMDSFVWAAGLR